MTYQGTMVLPKNAMMMQEDEMRYVEGGKTWSHTFKIKSKKWKVTVSNVKAATVAALGVAAAIAQIGAGLSTVIGSTGVLTIAGAAQVISGVALVGYSYSQLKKLISVKRVA